MCIKVCNSSAEIATFSPLNRNVIKKKSKFYFKSVRHWSHTAVPVNKDLYTALKYKYTLIWKISFTILFQIGISNI